VRVAIVHPWFLAFGGAEQTVSAIAEIYPEADIVTLFADQRGLPPQLAGRRVIVSRWNALPGKYRYYRHLLPFYPSLFEGIDLRGYDLVISSDSCVIKGVITDESAVHVCYCHSPMRCLYDQYWDYVEDMPVALRWYFKKTARRLKTWDFVAAHRLTGIVTNARYVANRVRTYYGLPSEVITPPVRTTDGFIDPVPEDYYLSVGRLVDAKRVEILIEACNRLKRRLIIVGVGRAADSLKAIAGPTVTFLGRVSDEQLAILYSRCRAFVFAAKEDFGITLLEAQSFGRPVIAFGEGGACETVVPSKTGLFFREQNAASLREAILHFEAIMHEFDPEAIREHACDFDAAHFKSKFSAFVELCIEAKKQQVPWTDVLPHDDASVPSRSIFGVIA